MEFKQVEEQIKENIGYGITELEFSDFIIAAINEDILKDNNRLADAFRYFDRGEEEGYIDHMKLLKAFNKCDCTSGSPKGRKF